MTTKINNLLLSALFATVFASVFAMPAAAIERHPYVGIAGGMSRVAPDVEGSAYTLDKDTSMAISLTLGLPLTQRVNGEIGYSHLGAAELSDNQDIGYSAFSLGAVAYVLGNEARLQNQSGVRAYVRLGLNLMDNTHDMPLTKANNTAMWAGVGVEWPIGARFSLRGELASFDGDAQAITVGLLFQPGALQSRGPATVSDPATVQAPATTLAITPTSAIEPLPTIERQPTIEQAPTTAPERLTVLQPEVQVIAQAEPTALPVPQVAAIAMPKSGVLGGVEFEFGTAVLTSIGKRLLDRLAIAMQAYPELNIQIGAHTDGVKGDAERLALTRSRAIVIARQLAANGVSISRMRARAFGANQPRAIGDSPGARRLNNRIEMTVR